MKIIDYLVVNHKHLMDTVDVVNNNIKAGYEPLNHCTWQNGLWCQTMVKVERIYRCKGGLTTVKASSPPNA